MLRGPRVARSAGGALGGVEVSPGGVALGCDGIGLVAGPLGLRGMCFGRSVLGDVLSPGVVVDGSFPDGPVIAPLPRDGLLGFSVPVELPFSPDGVELAPLPLPVAAFDRSRCRSFFGVEDCSLLAPLRGVVPGPFVAGPLLFSRSRLLPSGVVFDGVPPVAVPGRPFPVPGPLLSRPGLPPSGVAFGGCCGPPVTSPGRPLPG